MLLTPLVRPSLLLTLEVDDLVPLACIVGTPEEEGPLPAGICSSSHVLFPLSIDLAQLLFIPCWDAHLDQLCPHGVISLLMPSGDGNGKTGLPAPGYGFSSYSVLNGVSRGSRRTLLIPLPRPEPAAASRATPLYQGHASGRQSPNT